MSHQDLGAAIGAATWKSSPAVATVTAVETGFIPDHLQAIVLVLTAVGVVIQFSYTLWQWNNARKDRAKRG